MTSTILRALTVASLFLTVVMTTVSSPAVAEPANTAFERTWNRTDRPVIEQRVSRTWMWGPAPITGPMMESTTDHPTTGR